jgi:hypothetical protein
MIKEPRCEREIAALTQAPFDCPPKGFSILDEQFPAIAVNRISRMSGATPPLVCRGKTFTVFSNLDSPRKAAVRSR